MTLVVIEGGRRSSAEIEELKREARYDQDLWGDWVLTRVWGKQGTALGRIVHTPFSSYDGALEELVEVKARRERRGYKVREVVNEG